MFPNFSKIENVSIYKKKISKLLLCVIEKDKKNSVQSS